MTITDDTLKIKFREELKGRTDMSSVLRALFETDVYACLHNPSEDDYLDFLEMFEADFAEELDEILRQYESRYGIACGVILTADEIRENRDIAHYKETYEKLPIECRYRIETVLEYCLAKHADRTFVFNYNDGICQSFALRERIAPDAYAHCRDIVQMMICRLVDAGGEFLFTYRRDGRYIANGFLARRGRLYMATCGRIRSMQYTCVSPVAQENGLPVTAEMPNLLVEVAGMKEAYT